MPHEHLDIFSGLGGFSLAARWAGFETVAFCESDSRCREFLRKTWGIQVEPDIRKLDGRKYSGIHLLTGGPPCQPASRAGKQGGEKDDRWLWDEALRVLDEAKPDCVVFENPPGILDVGIDGILSRMEGGGYEAQPFDIPACAVDSPQLRHRIWIVGFLADAEKRGLGTNGSAPGQCGHADQRDTSGGMADPTEPGRERRDTERAPDGRGSERAESELAHTERERRERGSAESSAEESRESFGPASRLHWSNSVWVPCADNKLRRAPDDSFDVVDGVFAEVSGIVGSRPHRSLLGALGNSIVPQVAYEILKAVKQVIDAK